MIYYGVQHCAVFLSMSSVNTIELKAVINEAFCEFLICNESKYWPKVTNAVTEFFFLALSRY